MQKVKKLEPNSHIFCEDFAVKKKSHDLENYGMKMVWKTLSVNLFHYHGCCHIVCLSVLHCQCKWVWDVLVHKIGQSTAVWEKKMTLSKLFNDKRVRNAEKGSASHIESKIFNVPFAF